MGNEEWGFEIEKWEIENGELKIVNYKSEMTFFRKIIFLLLIVFGSKDEICR